ncbi:T9SS type A sorting domain-containing protein [Calditrichota bacterium]
MNSIRVIRREFLILLMVLMTLLIWRTDLMAQPDLQWVRAYGTNKLEHCGSLAITSNENFFIAGHAMELLNDDSQFDIYTLITDTQGDTLGTHIYGGQGSDIAKGAVPTDDGGCIISGGWGPYGLAMRIDEDGEQVWLNKYEDLGSGVFRYIAPTRDGNYLLCGESYEQGLDCWLVLIDDEGEVIWSEIYEGDSRQWGLEAIQTQDGGYVLVGSAGQPMRNDWQVIVLKVDADGEQEWVNYVGTEYKDQGAAIVEDRDGNLIIGGGTELDDGRDVDLLAKLDPDGEVIWMTSTDEEFISSLLISSLDGSIIAAGRGRGGHVYYNERPRDADLWLSKFDGDGEEQWEIDVEGSTISGFSRVLELPDYSYAAAGGASRNWRNNEPGSDNFILARTEPDPLVNGVIEIIALADSLDFAEVWLDSSLTETLFLTNLGERFGLIDSITVSNDETTFACSFTDSLAFKLFPEDTLMLPITFIPTESRQYEAVLNIWLPVAEDDTLAPHIGIVLTGEGKVNAIDHDLLPLPTAFTLSVYPNPFNASLRMEYTLPAIGDVAVQLLDISGRVVKLDHSPTLAPGMHTTRIDAEGLASGIYLVRLLYNNSTLVHKVALVK